MRKLSKFFIFIALGFNKNLVAQDNTQLACWLDTILFETELVRELKTDNISTFLIYHNLGNSGFGEAKGFLVDNNIPSGTNDNALPIPKCGEKCDIRMEAQPIDDSLFIIKYKWSFSKEFQIDTCYIFHYDGIYVAFPKRLYNEKSLAQTAFQWFRGPASTDDREVIRICTEENRTLFCKL